MPSRTRVAAVAGAAVLGVAGVLVGPVPAQAATTATAWVTNFAITYEAGTGQANSVATAKVFTSLGAALWQFTDVVPITAGAGCYHPMRDLSVVWCAAGGAMVIGVRTFDLNDTVKVGSPNTFVYAGAGDDTVTTPNDPSTRSYVYGEDGADTVVSGTSEDTIDGGPGADTISYQNRLGPICVDLVGWSSAPGGNPRVNSSMCETDEREDLYLYDSIENVVAGWNDDFIWGNDLANRVHGGGGNDDVYGLAGDDVVYGGQGNDMIESATGNDLLYGEAGDDDLRDNGHPGEMDLLHGGPGSDTCIGAAIAIDC